jgi:uncharacterized protein (DUF1778 family)
MRKLKSVPVYVPLSVRVEAGHKAALDKAAKADNRTLSSLVQKVLADWLKAKGFLK